MMRQKVSDWGDGKAKYNRSERYLAAVAYLDGVHPSIVMGQRLLSRRGNSSIYIGTALDLQCSGSIKVSKSD